MLSNGGHHGLLTFSINVTVDGCGDHQAGVADDEAYAFAGKAIDSIYRASIASLPRDPGTEPVMSATHEDGLGGHITILAHGDRDTPLRFRMVMPQGFGPPAPERHPSQREDFQVLRGTLDLGRINGARVLLHAGDSYTLPAGVYHLPSNPGMDELEFQATLTPGLDAEDMFVSLYAATREHQGLARFARVAMIFRRHSRTIAFPVPVRVVMSLVAAFASLLGVRIGPRHSLGFR